MEEIQLLYGLKDGELFHIDQVESGEKCGCCCPACSGTLIARKGEQKRHHFAHKAEGNCHHACETTLHLLAKKLLSEAKTFTIPKVLLQFPCQEPLEISGAMEIPVVAVELEQRYHPIIPDVVVTTTGNQKLMIEIFVTHAVDEEKLEKIKRIGISVTEIDLSAYRESAITEKSLKNILLKESEEKYWIFNRREAEYRQKFMEKSDFLFVVDGEVDCALKKYFGSKENTMVKVSHCEECPYCWDDTEGILCSARLRMTELEHIFCSEDEDFARLRDCEREEAKVRAELEQKRKFQEEKISKWHKNLNEGICPECGESLRFRRRKVDGHKFIACSGWIDEYEGCQFTLDVDSEVAQNCDFVKNHEIWSERSKQGKAERKCGWCGRPLVHREPKPNSKNWFRPFMSCSGFPRCKFTAYYTREELQALQEEKES